MGRTVSVAALEASFNSQVDDSMALVAERSVAQM
jgi:hypothetical protein